MLHYALRHGASLGASKLGLMSMISLALLAVGCGSHRPVAHDPSAVGAADDADVRPADSTIAAYGALTGVGLGAAAVGGYFMADAESSPDRTGSRPEFWGGFQAVAGGAALAIPFGYLTASSLLADDGGSGDDAGGAPVVARDARAPGITFHPRIGPGSVDVSGEF
jgi:hypothetical protein